MLPTEFSHDFPGASIGTVRSNGSKLGSEFLSDRVGFVVRFVIKKYRLIGWGVDVLAADLPHDAAKLPRICGVVTAADVLDPGLP